jgi:hypothetical protein
MAWKASGQPCDHFREHLLLNSGSFSTTANTDSDVFKETAIINGLPSRKGHLPDATAYATQPLTDSWGARVRGWCARSWAQSTTLLNVGQST